MRPKRQPVELSAQTHRLAPAWAASPAAPAAKLPMDPLSAWAASAAASGSEHEIGVGFETIRQVDRDAVVAAFDACRVGAGAEAAGLANLKGHRSVGGMRASIYNAVPEAAVIGIAHESHGEEVKAIVVVKPGSDLTREGLIAWCKERLAAYKYPRLVEFVDELPKGPTGKILKRELKA